MIGDLLPTLIRASLALSAALAVIFALRAPLRRWAGAEAAYALWLMAPVAALAALLPPPPAAIALLPAPTAKLIAPPQVSAPALPQAQAVGQTESAVSATEPVPTPVKKPFPLGSLLLGIWAGGALITGGLFVLRQALYAKHETGPAVVGAVFPRIILPADFALRFTPQEQLLILAHERAHLIGLHPQTNLMLCIIQSLQWFNPLVHIAARMVRTDQEMACDAAVMRAHPKTWRLYAQAMLKSEFESVR